MIKSFLINYFGFNRQQRNGLFILLAGIFLMFVARLALPYFITPDKIEIKNLNLAISENVAGNENKTFDNDQRTAATLFVFDPNTVTEVDLQKLGFSKKQAASFVKFRNKGFVFKKKEDLKKLFVVSDKMYDDLAAYVQIKPVKPLENKLFLGHESETTIAPTVTHKRIEKLELNTADTFALMALPGIGQTYAKRIIKYRSLLGGYVATTQLLEVFGFPPETYEKLKDQVYVNEDEVKKIDLNHDEFKAIMHHPYIGYDRTKAIFQFRKKNQVNRANLPELFPAESDLTKVLPYLSLP